MAVAGEREGDDVRGGRAVEGKAGGGRLKKCRESREGRRGGEEVGRAKRWSEGRNGWEEEVSLIGRTGEWFVDLLVYVQFRPYNEEYH